jgi:hypothetical protein
MKHKSLHESAAEILAASVAGAGKEPLPMSDMLMNPPVDLGGEMTTGDVTAVGDAASQSMEASPKPGQPGAPAEEMKTVENESEETEEKEEEEEEEGEEEEKPEAMMEALIAEHGEQVILESLISEHGEQAVYTQILESFVAEYGEDAVTDAFIDTLSEEIGDERLLDLIAESVVPAFHEQQLTEEQFNVLQEQSTSFITEMQTLSEEDFENYISNLTEEEFIYAIQLSSLNEEYLVEFLKKIGKALKKGVKAVGKVAKKAVKVVAKAAPLLSFIPGVGTAVGAVAGKLLGGIGSKIAGSALGKAVSAGASKLGSSVLGKAALSAGKSALQGGVSSVLQGGKFSQGAKLGAVTGLASPIVNKVAGGLAKATGSAAIGQTGADALAGGLANKAMGGSFSQGAKTGAIGSVVGRVAGGIGDAIQQRTGSDTAGNVARDVATAVADKAANRTKAASYGDQEGSDEAPEQDDVEQPTRVAQTTPQEREEDEDADSPSNFMRGVRANKVAARRPATRGAAVRNVAEETDDLLNELSALNEEQLDAFISSLSEEEFEALNEFVGPLARVGVAAGKAGKALVVAGKKAASGPKAAKISAAEKAAAITAQVATKSKAGAALKTVGRVAGKLALPVTAGLAAYDAKKGWDVDPNATTGKKALNALQGAASGATLGLIPGPTKAAAPAKKPVAPTKKSAVPGTDTPAGYDKFGRPAGSKDFGVSPAQVRARPAVTAAKPAAMSDEQRYGKTGAAIRGADKDAYAKRKDSAYLQSMGITAAPGSAEANTQLLQKLKDGKKPTAAAPAAAVVSEPTQATTPAQQSVTAGGSKWDDLSSWEANPIARGDAGEREDYEEAPTTPEKAGVGIFRTPTGEKTKLRKAIPNEIANIVGGLAGGVGQAFKIKELGYKKPGSRVNEQFEDSNMNDVNGEETTMETTELTEEQIREERMLAIKEAVKQFKGNMREDVDALFNGESLSEEFRAKATLIFESAVSSRVESILEQVMEQNDAVLAQAYDEIKDQLTEQVDEYLNYVVEQWMTENQVAIETGLRAELAEDFISGLRSLFQEHYIEIPEEKVDVAETLAAELEQAGEYVETVHQHIEAQNVAIADLQEQLNAVKKEKAIDNFCEGLTAVQAAKMKSLAEGVEFTAEGDFEEKLAVLRENYFPTKVQVKSEVKEIQQAMLNEEPEVEQTNNIMARYVKAIAKTAPKA